MEGEREERGDHYSKEGKERKGERRRERGGEEG